MMLLRVCLHNEKHKKSREKRRSKEAGKAEKLKSRTAKWKTNPNN
jgi:hypothetical protein